MRAAVGVHHKVYPQIALATLTGKMLEGSQQREELQAQETALVELSDKVATAKAKVEVTKAELADALKAVKAEEQGEKAAIRDAELSKKEAVKAALVEKKQVLAAQIERAREEIEVAFVLMHTFSCAYHL